jgi:hypothetical protein
MQGGFLFSRTWSGRFAFYFLIVDQNQLTGCFKSVPFNCIFEIIFLFFTLSQATCHLMKRRKFILTALAAAALIAIPVIRYKWRNSMPGDPLLTPDVLAHFCDEKEICEIGSYYRSCVPAEDRKDKLVQLILTGDNGKRIKLPGHDALSNWIDQKVREDFKEERTVIIDGWILSETEARQCALLSFGNN